MAHGFLVEGGEMDSVFIQTSDSIADILIHDFQGKILNKNLLTFEIFFFLYQEQLKEK